MTVEELSQLHRRYIDVSDQFKSAWTYHQFLEGVTKVFPGTEIKASALDFQKVFHRIKIVSRNLDASSVDRLRSDLKAIEKDLDSKLSVLRREDTRVPPSLLRQFFGQVDRYDGKILIQLARFYLISGQAIPWPSDRLDKADFLLTKIGEEIRSLRVNSIEQDPARLSDLLRSLWRQGNFESLEEEEISKAIRSVNEIRRELSEIPDLDQLNQRRLVQKYRALKHELNWRIFEPRVAHRVLETNLQFGETVQRLYSLEERRIAAEYQEVFELERGAARVDDALDEDLKEFHREIQRFEQHLEFKNVRLDELAYIRERVRNLIPRLRKSGATISAEDAQGAVDQLLEERDIDDAFKKSEILASEQGPNATTDEAVGLVLGQGMANDSLGEHANALSVGGERPKETLRVRTSHADIIGDQLRLLLKVLDATDWHSEPTQVVAIPEVQNLRLLPRDVAAFRRLHRPDVFDRQLEQFLIETAAIRIRINDEAARIIAHLDRGGGRDNALFTRARETTRLADQLQHRYAHFITDALQEGSFSEAQTLQFHRVRLLRDYSGLWLLAFG